MPRYNKSPNPSAIVDLTGWLGSGTRTRLTGLSGPPRTTGASVPFTTASFSASLGCSPATGAAAGQVWTGVGWIRSSVARTIRAALVTWNGTTFVGGGGTGIVDTALSANVWTQVRVTGTLNAATYTGVNFHLDIPATGTAGTLSLSSCRVEQISDAALTYADGDSGSGWVWDGTTGASTSTLPDAVTFQSRLFLPF